ncbi:MHC class I polypeptide-related sequence B-like isoform X1 [Saimiri boliviensis]|uniref:MHC class I polypeptide-related sequence B-like isoform X1 n=2 Tax=Saimiri boliviensis TaxID=27679 RepID=UPI00193D17CB|nr:MHC class I polypeptide-related sequence B-like [Saimiri boliviensis boliviensis]XP_010336431.2 MHC class I polypeptide-related sequence B-like [Saimiri boliviensis boliviensis]XP_010336432.2 MHC class I polypeptide-related sequence B-like [Saimiri boliviensis boliviensis]
MWLRWVLLSLVHILSFAPPGAATEPHSLRYILTVLSQDGSERSEFLAKVQLDDQPFLHYDGQNCMVEAVVRAEPCHREIEDLEENKKDLKMTLADIRKKKGALHSLQEIRLCEIHEDNSAKGIRHFYCDGELFLSQNLNTQEWTVPESSGAQILSINIMNDLKENAKKGGAVLADCRQKLLGYLESGVCIRRTVPPMVNVTRSEDSEGNINVTCWAFDFCPPNITLTWRQDGVSLSHDAQQSEGVLLDGNGTYRTWVTISIRQGEEQRFTCYAEYNGNHSTHPVPPGKMLVLEIQQSANPHVPAAAAAPDIFAGVIIGVLTIAGVITAAIIAVIL